MHDDQGLAAPLFEGHRGHGPTLDPFLKAYDIETGKELWRGQLPASSRAVPMTYQTGGKQFVAVAAGGHESSLGKLDNTLVVFSLP